MKAFSYRSLAGVAAMAAIAVPAHAGQKTGQDVIFSASQPVASGDLGFVRNTADAIQYIGCTVSGAVGFCAARNSAGVTHTCSSTDVALVTTMRTLNGDSYLVFSWNADGVCQVVQVRNDSRSPPK